MPDQATQTYATHRRYVPLYHFVAPFILLINLLWTFVGIYHFWRFGGRFDRVNSIVQVLVAVALIILWFYIRNFALAVQDRLIRHEMRVRLGELLSADQRARIPELSVGQLIALRFACRSIVTVMMPLSSVIEASLCSATPEPHSPMQTAVRPSSDRSTLYPINVNTL